MGARGFTLIELLVVLAIIGLLVALIPGFGFRQQPGLDLESAARAIADSLRATRSEAVLANRDQTFALDVERRQFRGGTRPPEQLDPAIAVRFQSARQEQQAETIGRIRFFPDGSSTGGRIALALGEQRLALEVDWLTGLVARRPAGPGP